MGGSMQGKVLKVRLKGGISIQLRSFYSSSHSQCQAKFDGEFFTFRLSHPLFLSSINLLLESCLSKNLFLGPIDGNT